MPTLILGIDAAWTSAGSSGVALLSAPRHGRPRCLAAAAGYEEFIRTCEIPEATRGENPIAGLLKAVESRAGNAADIVTIDMPVSREPVFSRREADNQVTRTYGGQGCSTHSPTQQRPGEFGAELTRAFLEAGYPVGTSRDEAGTPSRLLEVYPHPALLHLTGESYRLPYKAAKSKKHWPDLDVNARILRLLELYRRILDALACEIEDVEHHVQIPTSALSLSSLKPIEDTLDALVCAWVGWKYLQNQVTAYGDETAAIWIPSS